MEEKIKQVNPTLHRYLFTVTTFSKLLALSLFIILPFLGFYLGMQYQQKVTVAISVTSGVQKTTTPTPTDTTANWKTYTNKQYKYTFDYPPTLSTVDVSAIEDAMVGESNSQWHRVMTCNGCNQKNFGAFDGPFVVEVVDNPKGQSIEEFMKSFIGFSGDPKFQSMTIDGISAKRTTAIPGLLPTDSIFLNKGSKIFYITLVKGVDQKDISTDTFNKILSTFKFTQ